MIALFTVKITFNVHNMKPVKTCTGFIFCAFHVDVHTVRSKAAILLLLLIVCGVFSQGGEVLSSVLNR